jgi:hypothetical protein
MKSWVSRYGRATQKLIAFVLRDILGNLIWILKYKATSCLRFPLSKRTEKPSSNLQLVPIWFILKLLLKSNRKKKTKNVIFCLIPRQMSRWTQNNILGRDTHSSSPTYIGNGVPGFTDFRWAKNLTVICIIYFFLSVLRLLYHVWRALNVLLNTAPLSAAKTNKSLARKVSDFIVSAIWNIFRNLNLSFLTARYRSSFLLIYSGIFLNLLVSHICLTRTLPVTESNIDNILPNEDQTCPHKNHFSNQYKIHSFYRLQIPTDILNQPKLQVGLNY